MGLNNLRPAEGSVTKSKRIGRGQGTGKGGTSTKGHKGAKSRSGYKSKIGFEGGQMPLQRRIPKFGFRNPNRVEYTVLNLDQIQTFLDNKRFGKDISIDNLKKLGIISKNEKLKILADGELKTAINIEANKCSKKAKEVIDKLGGSIKLI